MDEEQLKKEVALGGDDFFREADKLSKEVSIVSEFVCFL